MHGLARPCPVWHTARALGHGRRGTFAAGLFSSYLGMLLQPPVLISWELFVVVFTWFLASWYLFRMLQRLLFRSASLDLSYGICRRPGYHLCNSHGGNHRLGFHASTLDRVAPTDRQATRHLGDCTVVNTAYSEVERMELRALIQLSSEIIAYYWPMRTFVHHNPLHGLEDFHFDDAVQRGRLLLGGKAYLPVAMFRDYYRAGRIQPRHLDDALAANVNNEVVACNGLEVCRLEVRRAQLIHGLSAPANDKLDHWLKTHPQRQTISALAQQLAPLAGPL